MCLIFDFKTNKILTECYPFVYKLYRQLKLKLANKVIVIIKTILSTNCVRFCDKCCNMPYSLRVHHTATAAAADAE